MTRTKFLEKYKNDGFEQVEGWCGRGLFDVVDLLDSVEINKKGGCLEIGVYHGKFYLLLNSVIEPSYRSYALDLFDDQKLNIDGSGSGDLESFKTNLIKYDRYKGTNTEIILGDSTDLKITNSFRATNTAFRFISVDGGHTPEHTISDLNLANELIANEGIVLLDDILNYHWLGVIEGAVNFMARKPTLVPFAIGHNKLLFAKLSYCPFYFDLFHRSDLRSKTVDFFGHKIVCLLNNSL